MLGTASGGPAWPSTKTRRRMIRTSGVLRSGVSLFASASGFAIAVLIYSLLTDTAILDVPFTLALIPAVLALWVVTELRADEEDLSPSVMFVELVSLATGVNLILQALLAYAFDLPVVPLPVLIGGSAVA